MKTNKKIHKLGALCIMLLTTIITVHDIDVVQRKFNLNDARAELKKASQSRERELSKGIKVQKTGITYNNMFIPNAINREYRVLTVRLTVYWAKGGDTDGDTKRLRSSTGYTLKQGDSIAVDPNIIPYNSEVIIPNVGLVKAVDTGTAVREKVASGGKLPVIDVFFNNKSEALRFANNYPKVIKVAVLN